MNIALEIENDRPLAFEGKVTEAGGKDISRLSPSKTNTILCSRNEKRSPREWISS